jgi:hypothetical protein
MKMHKTYALLTAASMSIALPAFAKDACPLDDCVENLPQSVCAGGGTG